jgi:uncharacterized protein
MNRTHLISRISAIYLICAGLLDLTFSLLCPSQRFLEANSHHHYFRLISYGFTYGIDACLLISGLGVLFQRKWAIFLSMHVLALSAIFWGIDYSWIISDGTPTLFCRIAVFGIFLAWNSAWITIIRFHKTTVDDYKHKRIIEVIVVFAITFKLRSLFGSFIPSSYSTPYLSSWLSMVLAAAYLFNRYPQNVFSLSNISISIKYGAGVGILITIPLVILRFLYSSGNFSLSSLSTFGGIFAFLLPVLVAPLVEEALFRGCFYRIMKDQYGVFWSALLVSILFAAIHPIGIGNSVGVFIKSLLYTYAYQKSGSLWGSVIAHIINNGLIRIL